LTIRLIASRPLLRSPAVVRFRIWLATALVLGAIVSGLLRAQVSEEPKNRDESERSETRAAPSPKPKKSPSPASMAAGRKRAKKRRVSPTPDKEAQTVIPRAKPAAETAKREDESSATAEKTPAPSPRAKAAEEDSGGAESPGPGVSPRARRTEPRASPKSRRSHKPTPKPKAAKKKSGEKVAGKTAKSAQSKREGEEQKAETPKPEKTPAPGVEERGASSESSPPPRAMPVLAATPAPSPQTKVPRALPAGEQAQVVIEKSGVEEDQGFEPPPSPPPRRFFLWPWSRPTNYHYLTRSVIEAIRRAPVKRHRWQFIVVHNSGTRQGNARVFDYYHRHVRHMQNGLAYHFVIGNGTSTGNGQIEVGDRWRRQINGGHVHSDYLNSISLGICLVGDFNRDQPTRAQLEACEELIRYLRQRCGGTGRGAIPVKPHREMNPPRWPTDCPGDDFPYSWFRRF
jgi:hypothetical protein